MSPSDKTAKFGPPIKIPTGGLVIVMGREQRRFRMPSVGGDRTWKYSLTAGDSAFSL